MMMILGTPVNAGYMKMFMYVVMLKLEIIAILQQNKEALSMKFAISKLN